MTVIVRHQLLSFSVKDTARERDKAALIDQNVNQFRRGYDAVAIVTRSLCVSMRCALWFRVTSSALKAGSIRRVAGFGARRSAMRRRWSTTVVGGELGPQVARDRDIERRRPEIGRR